MAARDNLLVSLQLEGLEEKNNQTTDQQAAGEGCEIETFKLNCLEK